MPSAEAFQLAWRDIVKDVDPPSVVHWDSKSGSLSFVPDEIATLLLLHAEPVPNGEAEAAAAHSVSALRSGGFKPATHVAQLIVVSSSSTASHVERLLRQTRVVAALTKATAATGVYEGNAGATHDPEFYVDMTSDSSALPLMLWTGISLVRKPAATELLTLGMSQFELPDILLVAPPSEANEALLFVFDLVGYVLGRGSAIPEGETVGRTAEEKLAVTYVASPLDPSARVMRVELPGVQKKSWWPFGRG